MFFLKYLFRSGREWKGQGQPVLFLLWVGDCLHVQEIKLNQVLHLRMDFYIKIYVCV